MKRKAIVFGATGKTGVHICDQLAAQKIQYAIFARSESAGKVSKDQKTILTGDVMNPSDVKDAVSSDEYSDVIIALGSKALRGSTIRSKGTENIIAAVKEADISATIHVISALGVGESWDQLKWHAKLLSNLLLKSVMNDHAIQEKMVIDSQLKFHIIRPVGLKDGEATDTVHVQEKGYLPKEYIQRADVAKYLIDSLLENKEGFSSIC